MERIKLGKIVKQLLRFSESSTAPEPENYCEPRLVASRFRAQCADHGPYEIAAAIAAPTEIDAIPDELRVISYLFAAAVAPDNARELCVEQGIFGLQEWMEVNAP